MSQALEELLAERGMTKRDVGNFLATLDKPYRMSESHFGRYVSGKKREATRDRIRGFALALAASRSEKDITEVEDRLLATVGKLPLRTDPLQIAEDDLSELDDATRRWFERGIEIAAESARRNRRIGRSEVDPYADAPSNDGD